MYISSNRDTPSIISPLSFTNIKNVLPKSLFSLENAPRESLIGTIATISGDFYWESRTATNPSRLTNYVNIQQGEKLIASDSGVITVNFGDGTTVSMQPYSTVDIIQTLPNNIVFRQSSGEVFYEASSSSPVSMRALNLLAQIEHGKFRISIDTDTNIVRVIVEKGQGTIAYNNVGFKSMIIPISENDVFEFESDLRRGFFQ